MALGCRTILTSGQASSAPAGLEILRTLRARAAGRIGVMVGCGVKKENIRAIFDGAGITAFHTSGRGASIDSGMVYRKAGVSMGLPSLSEYEIWRTDPEEFRLCAEIVHGLL